MAVLFIDALFHNGTRATILHADRLIHRRRRRLLNAPNSPRQRHNTTITATNAANISPRTTPTTNMTQPTKHHASKQAKRTRATKSCRRYSNFRLVVLVSVRRLLREDYSTTASQNLLTNLFRCHRSVRHSLSSWRSCRLREASDHSATAHRHASQRRT
jgi:hypothetical protein